MIKFVYSVYEKLEKKKWPDNWPVSIGSSLIGPLIKKKKKGLIGPDQFGSNFDLGPILLDFQFFGVLQIILGLKKKKANWFLKTQIYVQFY